MKLYLKLTESEYDVIWAHSYLNGGDSRGEPLRGAYFRSRPELPDEFYCIIVADHNIELFKNDLIAQISKGVDNVIIGGIPTDKIKLQNKKNKKFNELKSVLAKLK